MISEYKYICKDTGRLKYVALSDYPSIADTLYSNYHNINPNKDGVILSVKIYPTKLT